MTLHLVLDGGRRRAVVIAVTALMAVADVTASWANGAATEAPARVIGAGEISALIAEALAGDNGEVEALGVELADPMFAMAVPGGGEVVVEDVARDSGGRRFAARIATAGGSDETGGRRIVTGRVHRMAEVPVLSRPIGRGEVIAAADVEWVRLKNSRLGSSTIVEADDLIGLSARRALRPGVPVRASQVRRPVVVAKGSQVSLVLNGPGLALSARGRALEDGGRGEVIRVSNLQSNVVVEGAIAGPGLVRIRPPARIGAGAAR